MGWREAMIAGQNARDFASEIDSEISKGSDAQPPLFDAFVQQALATASSGSTTVTPAHPLLNGVPYTTFRRNVGIETRREIGAFFSGQAIAASLVNLVSSHVTVDALVLDPTCGIGDLLLARAAALPVKQSLAKTVTLWGDCLAGFDTRADLVQLCKARLCMLARARGGFTDDIDTLQAFPLIREQDFMSSDSDALLSRADAVLFNPPFGKTTWPSKLDWAAGEINAAAIFLDRLTRGIKPGSPIAAVLPEVLRCGSRYERFRSTLTDRRFGGSFKAVGRFDAWTDVDVFTTLLSQADTAAKLWEPETAVTGKTVEDGFEVRVGTVVPHRDPEAGEKHPYICAKTTPAWEMDFSPQTYRAYGGRVFQPPFVAIRRTSSPSDRFRAVATVVTGDLPVAVENHLLVATPRDQTVSSCRALLDAFHTKQINDRLNAMMRCRHLTTGAIKALPWKSKK